MKRKLAPEALYSSDHYDSHYPVAPEDSDEELRRANERLKIADPDGSKALALLRELES
jgi:hypothetical protein